MKKYALSIFFLLMFLSAAHAVLTLSAFPDSIHYNPGFGYTDARFVSVTNSGADSVHYNVLTNPPALLANQTAYYPLDDSYSDQLTNTSGTVTGTSFVADKFAQPQHALHLNGYGERFVTRNFNLEDSFSFSFWAKPQAAQTLFAEGYYNHALYSGYILYPEWGGYGTRAGLGVALGTNGIMVAEHANSYMPCLLSFAGDFSGWNHITVVFSDHVPKLYVNGILVRTGIPSQRATTYMSSYWGGWVYGDYHGMIDEIGVYNGALTQQQVTAAYQFNPDSRYYIQPRAGVISPGQTVQVLVRMTDATLAAGNYNDAITICQAELPPSLLQMPVTIDIAGPTVPMAPEQVIASLQANGDVLLQWSPVTMSTDGSSVTPTAYLVYALDNLGDTATSTYLGSTAATQFTDVRAELTAAITGRYYYVTAYLGD